LYIASWNVNSLKVRLPQVLAWLEQYQPDVLALQETKIADQAFPAQTFRDAGWHVACNGQKTYNGVALVAQRPIEAVMTDPPGLSDEQRRVLAATVDGVRLYNLYVPNGKAVDSASYAYKLDWLARAASQLGAELSQHRDLIVLGDFNIAPTDSDVYDPQACAGSIHCSERERAALNRLLALGLHDTLQRADGRAGQYSWWDYRANAFKRNLGLRIDLILASDSLAPRLTYAGIDIGPRRNERPSDHAPVVAGFA